MPSIAEILAARNAGKPTRATTRGLLTTELPEKETTPPAPTPPQERALGTPQGELMDLTPLNADPTTKAWMEACTGFESELCIMRDALGPETCWLALRMSGQGRPILLHRLPWLMWEHPETPRTEAEPF